MARLVPDWPVLMTSRTAASYLDCAWDETGNVKPTWKQWRETPGFPRPDPITGFYYRPAIDRFLAQHFGYSDPLEAEKEAMDKEFAG